jgi:hypothetical protein
MKRPALTVAVLLIVILVAGTVSNLAGLAAVERYVQRENETSLHQVAALWHLPVGKRTTVPRASLHFSTRRNADGKVVTFQSPPRADLPFAYAYGRQVAPFLLRVQYGWAIGGKRMAFGEGGQKLVFSLFGRPWVLRRSPSWQF